MYEEETLELGKVALFRVFGLSIYPYALLLVIGAVIALIMALWRAKKLRVSQEAVLTFAMLAIPLSVLLGRLVYCGLRLAEVTDFGVGYVFRLDYGGFSLVGVLLGLLLAAGLTRRLNGERMGSLLDAVVPGLIILLAVARFAEGATANGIGLEVNVDAFKFMPLARKNFYDEYVYAIHFFEGVTALIVGVYAQTVRRETPGQAAGIGVILVSAAQILWECTRRDDVLIVSFVRVNMVAGGVVLLAVLILSVRRLDWPWTGKTLVFLGFFLCMGVVAAMEFAVDGKILYWLPYWACYLTDALAVAAMGWLCVKVLNAACEA